MRKFVSFRSKLMFYTTLIVIIAVTMVGGYCIFTHFQHTRKILLETTVDIAKATEKNISTEFEKYSVILGSQSNIKQIFDLGELYEDTDRGAYSREIQSVIENMYLSVTGIYGLGFIDARTGTVCCAGNTAIAQVLDADRTAQAMPDYDTGREIWFFQQDKQGQIIIYKYLYYISDAFQKSPVGQIFMMVNEESIYHKVFDGQRELYGSIVMVDGQGVIVSGTARDLIGREFAQVFSSQAGGLDDGAGKYMTVDGHIDISGWDFRYLISEQELYSNIYSTVWFIIAVLFGCLLMAFGLAFIFSAKISNPLVVLYKYMGRMAEGRYDELPPHPENDEIGMVYNSYNDMVVQLNEQINHNMAMELQVKDARIQAYEMQINPHFIYNTLQLIQMLSIMGKNKEIEDAAVCLGSILRFNLKGEKEVMVRDEVENIKNYFKILSLRYGDSISYNINIDEHIMDKYILKFLFQPLVENSLKHGIELVERKGEITIYAREMDDEIVFIVKDNGLGLTEAQLKTLNQSINMEDSGQGIGLRNVNQRIKLFYGERFGIEVFSVYDKKTEIFIHLPSNDKKTTDNDW